MPHDNSQSIWSLRYPIARAIPKRRHPRNKKRQIPTLWMVQCPAPELELTMPKNGEVQEHCDCVENNMTKRSATPTNLLVRHLFPEEFGCASRSSDMSRFVITTSEEHRDAPDHAIHIVSDQSSPSMAFSQSHNRDWATSWNCPPRSGFHFPEGLSTSETLAIQTREIPS
jgi:hypothetical protein